MIQRLRFWLALKLWPRRMWGTAGARSWSILQMGQFEYRLVRRDTARPNIYTRVEVLRMLNIVRQQEQRMNWTCPEPTEDDLLRNVEPVA